MIDEPSPLARLFAAPYSYLLALGVGLLLVGWLTSWLLLRAAPRR